MSVWYPSHTAAAPAAAPADNKKICRATPCSHNLQGTLLSGVSTRIQSAQRDMSQQHPRATPCSGTNLQSAPNQRPSSQAHTVTHPKRTHPAAAPTPKLPSAHQRHPAAAPAPKLPSAHGSGPAMAPAPKRTQQRHPAAAPAPKLPSAHGSGPAASAAPKLPSAHSSDTLQR